MGIDLAKDSSRVAVVDKDGNKLSSPFSIKNKKDGMEKLLLKLGSYRNDQILCGMEASSNYFRKRLLIPKREKDILSTS
ncbi:MAG: transposase [Clostridia bacterium]|nr:transposase [Clostridia bacterium]